MITPAVTESRCRACRGVLWTAAEYVLLNLPFPQFPPEYCGESCPANKEGIFRCKWCGRILRDNKEYEILGQSPPPGRVPKYCDDADGRYCRAKMQAQRMREYRNKKRREEIAWNELDALGLFHLGRGIDVTGFMDERKQRNGRR